MTDNAPRPTRTTRYLAWSDDHHYLAKAWTANRDLLLQCSVVAQDRTKARTMVTLALMQMHGIPATHISCIDLTSCPPRGIGDSIDWCASSCLTEEGWAQADLTPTIQYSHYNANNNTAR